ASTQPFGGFLKGRRGRGIDAHWSIKSRCPNQGQSEAVSKVRELLCGLIEPTRKESGCISYELLQNRDDPTDFTFVEEWETDAAFENHAASDHIKAIGPKLQSVVADPPDIRTYLA